MLQWLNLEVRSSKHAGSKVLHANLWIRIFHWICSSLSVLVSGIIFFYTWILHGYIEPCTDLQASIRSSDLTASAKEQWASILEIDGLTTRCTTCTWQCFQLMLSKYCKGFFCVFSFCEPLRSEMNLFVVLVAVDRLNQSKSKSHMRSPGKRSSSFEASYQK